MTGRKRRGMGVAAVAALLPLAGCIDIEMQLAFLDAEVARAEARLEMAREVYDLWFAGQEEFCEGGDLSVGAERAACTFTQTMAIADLMAGGRPLGDELQAPGDGIADGFAVREIGSGLFEVRFELEESFAGWRPAPAEDGGSGDLVREMLAGHFMTIRVLGAEVRDSTGNMSPDGTMADRVIPMAAFLESPPALGGAFVSTVVAPTP